MVGQFRKVDFLKLSGGKAILQGKSSSRLLYSGINEISVIPLKETQQYQEVNLWHLTNMDRQA
jgi:hypothetical protein